MGLYLSRVYSLFAGFQRNPARVLMLGLDAAGKTTILYKIKLNESVCTIPTIGFNVETVEPVAGVTFTVWDVGGQEKLRALWRHYFQNTEGLIFVVDSADRERIPEASKELGNILEDDSMRGVPVVVMANKQDLPGALGPYDVVEKLGLRGMGSRSWHVQGCCASNGEGLYESMDKLAKLVKEFKAKH